MTKVLCSVLVAITYVCKGIVLDNEWRDLTASLSNSYTFLLTYLDTISSNIQIIGDSHLFEFNPDVESISDPVALPSMINSASSPLFRKSRESFIFTKNNRLYEFVLSTKTVNKLPYDLSSYGFSAKYTCSVIDDEKDIIYVIGNGKTLQINLETDTISSLLATLTIDHGGPSCVYNKENIFVFSGSSINKLDLSQTPSWSTITTTVTTQYSFNYALSSLIDGTDYIVIAAGLTQAQSDEYYDEYYDDWDEDAGDDWDDEAIFPSPFVYSFNLQTYVLQQMNDFVNYGDNYEAQSLIYYKDIHPILYLFTVDAPIQFLYLETEGPLCEESKWKESTGSMTFSGFNPSASCGCCVSSSNVFSYYEDSEGIASTWTDFQLSVVINIKNKDKDINAGIAFRSGPFIADNYQRNGYQLRILPKIGRILLKYQPGNINIGRYDLEYEVGVDHVFDIYCIGDSIQIFMDDLEIIYVSYLSDANQGTIGIISAVETTFSQLSVSLNPSFPKIAGRDYSALLCRGTQWKPSHGLLTFITTDSNECIASSSNVFSYYELGWWNFQLSVVINIKNKDKDINAGIAFRSGPFIADNYQRDGYQLRILPKIGRILLKSQPGNINIGRYDLEYEVGIEHLFDIYCVGDRITISMNNEKIIDVTDSSSSDTNHKGTIGIISSVDTVFSKLFIVAPYSYQNVVYDYYGWFELNLHFDAPSDGESISVLFGDLRHGYEVKVTHAYDYLLNVALFFDGTLVGSFLDALRPICDDGHTWGQSHLSIDYGHINGYVQNLDANVLNVFPTDVMKYCDCRHRCEWDEFKVPRIFINHDQINMNGGIPIRIQSFGHIHFDVKMEEDFFIAEDSDSISDRYYYSQMYNIWYDIAYYHKLYDRTRWIVPIGSLHFNFELGEDGLNKNCFVTSGRVKQELLAYYDTHELILRDYTISGTLNGGCIPSGSQCQFSFGIAFRMNTNEYTGYQVVFSPNKVMLTYGEFFSEIGRMTWYHRMIPYPEYNRVPFEILCLGDHIVVHIAGVTVINVVIGAYEHGTFGIVSSKEQTYYMEIADLKVQPLVMNQDSEWINTGTKLPKPRYGAVAAYNGFGHGLIEIYGGHTYEGGPPEYSDSWILLFPVNLNHGDSDYLYLTQVESSQGKLVDAAEELAEEFENLKCDFGEVINAYAPQLMVQYNFDDDNLYSYEMKNNFEFTKTKLDFTTLRMDNFGDHDSNWCKVFDDEYKIMYIIADMFADVDGDVSVLKCNLEIIWRGPYETKCDLIPSASMERWSDPAYPSCAFYDDNIYLFGYENGEKVSKLDVTAPNPSWAEIVGIIGPFSGSLATNIYDKIVITGGEKNLWCSEELSNLHNDCKRGDFWISKSVYLFNTQDETLVRLKDMNSRRTKHFAMYHPPSLRLYVFGGLSWINAGSTLDSIEYIDIFDSSVTLNPELEDENIDYIDNNNNDTFDHLMEIIFVLGILNIVCTIKYCVGRNQNRTTVKYQAVSFRSSSESDIENV